MIGQQKAVLIIGEYTSETILLQRTLTDARIFSVLHNAELYNKEDSLSTEFYNQFDAIVFTTPTKVMPNLYGYIGKIFNNPLRFDVGYDKLKTYAMCIRNDIPTIRTTTLTTYSDQKMPYPVIVKPRFGAHGSAMRKVMDLDGLKPYLSYNGDDYLVQEFVDSKTTYGTAYKIYISGKTEYYAIESREDVYASTNGTLKFVDSIDSDAINLARRVYDLLDLNVACIDLIKRDNEYLVCDISLDSLMPSDRPIYIAFAQNIANYLNKTEDI